MQYMVVATQKDTASPSDVAAVLKKFQSFQPPAGLTMEGNWSNGAGRGYGLVSTDDYTLVGEVLARFSSVFDFRVDPVVSTDQMTPATLRGLE